MKPSISMADDEYGFLREILRDDELARKVADSDTHAGASLLLKSVGPIIAIMLWRNRTGEDLKTAMTAVDAIADASAREKETTSG